MSIHGFSYNVDNRLTRVTEGLEGNFDNTQQTINTNTFRGDGQRISKTEHGQVINYIYQDGSVLYTTDDNHDLINLHLKAPDGALISMLHARSSGNQVSNFTTDVRQSTSTVLCDRGEFFTGFRYTDFGETTRLVDTDELIEIAYTGGVWDEVTGLYYLNARFYNPTDARFLTMDVARNGGDLRATLSLYGYTEGDPINKVDPSGYASWWILSRRKVTTADINRRALTSATRNAISLGFGFVPLVGTAVSAGFTVWSVASRVYNRVENRMQRGDVIRMRIRRHANFAPSSHQNGQWAVGRRLELRRMCSRCRNWRTITHQTPQRLRFNLPRNHGARTWNNGQSVSIRAPIVRAVR